MSDLVKIHFSLVQDEDEYPPVGVESVWAKQAMEPGHYVIDNIPFFACEATLGDLVVAYEKENNLWFDKVIKRSRNSLLRIVLFDKSSLTEVNQSLIDLGCTTEYERTYNLLAVNVPDRVRLVDVQEYLQKQSASGLIDYEEPILRQ